MSFFLNLSSLNARQAQDSINNYYTIANFSTNTEDLLSAFEFYKNRKDENLKRKHTDKKVVEDLWQIAIIQLRLDLLNESETTAIEGLKTIENSNQLEESFTKESEIGLNNHLGRVSQEKKDYKEALNYYKKALNLSETLALKNSIRQNTGYLYYHLEDYDLSRKIFEDVLKDNLITDDTIKIARSMTYLGMSQSKLGIPTALENIEKALQLRKDINYDLGVFDSHYNLSEYYKDRDDNKKAKRYIEKALSIAKNKKDIGLKLSALSSIVDLNEDNYVQQFKFINDSISAARQQIKNQYSAKKYNVEKQVAIAQEYKLQKTIYLLLGLLITIIAIGLYFLLKSKHKKDKIKQAYQNETEFSKKVHDELANDMSDLMNFVAHKIDADATEKTTLLDTIEDIYVRTRDISTEKGSIDLTNFSQSIKHLLMQHNKEDTQVITNDVNTINWEKISSYKKIVVYRCLQELMVNMKKHSKAKVVSIVFKKVKKRLVIKYVDDGVGCSKEEAKRNGLLNVESRIKKIDGTFNFTTSKGNGFKATLEFNS